MIGFEGQVVDQQHQSDAQMQSPMASREDTASCVMALEAASLPCLHALCFKRLTALPTRLIRVSTRMKEMRGDRGRMVVLKKILLPTALRVDVDIFSCNVIPDLVWFIF
ncbi:hypothetical protein ACFX13_022082 [Malus domestica]